MFQVAQIERLSCLDSRQPHPLAFLVYWVVFVKEIRSRRDPGAAVEATGKSMDEYLGTSPLCLGSCLNCQLKRKLQKNQSSDEAGSVTLLEIDDGKRV